MNQGLALLVDVIACYRITVFVTADYLSLRTRERIIRWDYLRHGMPADLLDDDVPGTRRLEDMVKADLEQGDTATTNRLVPKVSALIICRWCASVYVAAGVAVARWTIPVVWTPVAWVLTASAVAALLSGLEQ